MSTAASLRGLLLPLHPPLPPKCPSASAFPSLPRRGVLHRQRLRLAVPRPRPRPPLTRLSTASARAPTSSASSTIPTRREPRKRRRGVSGALVGREWWEWASLVSPFFFWGTAMVAMKGVIPKTGPFVVAAPRLLPAGALVVAFAATRGRKQPSGWATWGAIDAACFQGFLTEGLQRTSAGLGSHYSLESLSAR